MATGIDKFYWAFVQVRSRRSGEPWVNGLIRTMYELFPLRHFGHCFCNCFNCTMWHVLRLMPVKVPNIVLEPCTMTAEGQNEQHMHLE